MTAVCDSFARYPQPYTKPPAILPCLPADDGRFECITPLTHHIGRWSTSRLLNAVVLWLAGNFETFVVAGRFDQAACVCGVYESITASIAPMLQCPDLELHSFSSLGWQRKAPVRRVEGNIPLRSRRSLDEVLYFVSENTKTLPMPKSRNFAVYTQDKKSRGIGALLAYTITTIIAKNKGTGKKTSDPRP